ncbi:Structure-specific endonuclease subunit slx1-like protein, partial [Thalictrum thalictroides]
FTVNPCRRIRQHNGEIRCGAESTKSKRPWEMVLCIYGFPTNVSALQFEWAWQNPTESLAVRDAAVGLKSLSGIVGKIMLAYTMLTLPPWMSLNLTVNFFSTKYMNNAASCPSLPKQMKVQICPMDELPCYTDGQMFYDVDDLDDIDDAENGTNNIHLEGHGDISVFNESDYHHSSVEGVDGVQKCNENNAVRQAGEDWPGDSLSSREANPLQEPWTVRGKDHKFLFDLVDSVLGSSSTVTSLEDTVETIEEKDTLCMSEMGSDEFGQVTEPPLVIPIASKEHQPNEPHNHREDHYKVKVSVIDTPEKTPFSSGFIETVGDNDTVLFSPGLKSSQKNEPSICSRRLQFSVLDTPVKTQFSYSGLVKTVDAAQDKDYHYSITSLSSDKDRPPSGKRNLASPKVEVIDILTPSSNSMINLFRQKKRRNNWVSQDIIDLTKSPNFI